MRITKAIANLRQQVHDDLRRQHPEWVLPNGESPMCDAYEARLMDLLGVQPTDDARPKGNASEMRSTPRLSQAFEPSDRHHNLAHLLIALQIAMRLDDLV